MLLSLRVAVCSMALATSGCGLVSCEHAPGDGRLGATPSAPSEWPRAFAPDLPAATPATEVIVRAERVEVRNEALIATWPADALERASLLSDAPDWPRVAEVIPLEGSSGAADPRAVQGALERARRAEQSATGEGTGASAFNLRVASEVPFEQVERVLHAAARAGYATPRILLATDGAERMLRWPSARPEGPTREQIEAALRGDEAAIAPPAPRPRIVLTNERATVSHRGATVCAIEGPLERGAIGRCARELHHAGGRLTLEVAPAARFDRVAAIVQAVTTTFDEVRVVRGAMP